MIQKTISATESPVYPLLIKNKPKPTLQLLKFPIKANLIYYRESNIIRF